MSYSLSDRLIMHFDCAIRKHNNLNYPAANLVDPIELTTQDKKQSIRMMRINHSGEVCAQALYQGQAFMAKDVTQFCNLIQAAQEESQHLAWCAQRLQELNGRTSYLNPFWFGGSFLIGVIAGLNGDKISLGFLAETELQVTAHIEKHLREISPHDHKSRSILQKMRTDELQHATQAKAAGASELPVFIKQFMRLTAKILTVTAGRI